MSFDDIVSTFWNDDDASATVGKFGGMNRSASEFSFQEFLKESSGGEPRGKSRFVQQCGEDRNGGELPMAGGGFTPPMFASTEELRAMNNVVDCGEQDDVAVQFDPVFPGMQVDGEPNNFTSFAVAGDLGFERSLKQTMDIAAAAASLFRGNGDGGSMGLLGGALPVTKFAIGSSGGTAVPSAGHGASASAPPVPAWKPEVDASGKPKLMTSGSEVSDDEEHVVLLNQNLPGSELKRVKRMLSNRESARKSRRRKQAHLGELEEQVSHLTDENSRLINRLHEVSHLHKESAIETRILKADVEALRAKVKMAEGMMAQHGQPGMTNYIPDSSFSFMTPYMSNDMERPFPGHSSMLRHDPPQASHGGNMDRTASMQRVASLERLQQRIRTRSSCNAPAWGGWETDRPGMVREPGI